MPIYDTCDIYIMSVRSAKQRLARIEAVIDVLEASLLKAAANEDVLEYSLDDGQTKITTIYKSSQSITNAIMGMEKLRQLYMNRLNGRVMRLIDSKNFRRRR